ncbi:MAG: threonine dehydratase [Parvicellaceae bacterium]|jgi:threonine dehydratase
MLKLTDTYLDVDQAAETLKGVSVVTPLQKNQTWSDRLNCEVFLKREDLQVVRSYKIRGAYNKMSSLSKMELNDGIVCASAGNHAQGVAYSCALLKVNGVIFMPTPTPKQKLEQVEMFGGEFIKVILEGDTFDEAAKAAYEYCDENNLTFIHPFNDTKVIEGQATVGREILQQIARFPDYIFVPVGGGGLASGVAFIVKAISKKTKIIGVEPEGAASFTAAKKAGYPVKLKAIDKFIDGAAVQEMGNLTFEMCNELLDDIITVSEGAVCTTILDLYNRDAIVVEPAGALALTGAKQYKLPAGSMVVAVMSGSNNDITRMEEIKERSLLNEGHKHYFLVSFPQRSGALKDFVNDVLSDGDDITYFEYAKKHNREKGPVKIGVYLAKKENLERLRSKMTKLGFKHEYMNDKPEVLTYFL